MAGKHTSDSHITKRQQIRKHFLVDVGYLKMSMPASRALSFHFSLPTSSTQEWQLCAGTRTHKMRRPVFLQSLKRAVEFLVALLNYRKLSSSFGDGCGVDYTLSRYDPHD